MSIRIEDLAKMDFRSVTVAGGKRISPTSPGEMPRDEFLKRRLVVADSGRL